MNWIKRNWKLLVIASVPFVVAAWWLFRPEKLFVNERVNEPATFVSTEQAAPIFTGKLEARRAPTKGRATIYKAADGKLELRLTDFETAKDDDVQVVLANPEDRALQGVAAKGAVAGTELGMVRGDAIEQRFAVPAGVDFAALSAVVIYGEKSRQVLGVAKLEAF